MSDHFAGRIDFESAEVRDVPVEQRKLLLCRKAIPRLRVSLASMRSSAFARVIWLPSCFR